MKSWASQVNLINEYKGNIFEYLVALQLAKHFGLEASFYDELDRTYLAILQKYEQALRQSDPELVRILPKWADQAAHELIAVLPSLLNLKKILLVGKLSGGALRKEMHESDFLLETEDSGLPISLKLCKSQHYVNTKNAGTQSFIARYFPMASALQKQEEINRGLASSYYEMGKELYRQAGISHPFLGSFGPEWSEQGFSELPGELTPAMKKTLGHFYHRVIALVYQACCDLYREDARIFTLSLLELCGISHPQMVQVTCFHSVQQELEVKILGQDDFAQAFQELAFSPLKPGISSFELSLGKFLLQIRAKPMNKFTSMGLKINCSLKHSFNKSGQKKD
jgi:hypothetical protein